MNHIVNRAIEADLDLLCLHPLLSLKQMKPAPQQQVYDLLIVRRRVVLRAGEYIARRTE